MAKLTREKERVYNNRKTDFSLNVLTTTAKKTLEVVGSMMDFDFETDKNLIENALFDWTK